MASEVERAVAVITDRLGAARVDAIWLFGSRARGAAHPASDLDLAVLARPSLSLLERGALMDLAGRSLGMDVDVIDLETAESILAWEVMTTGKLVFDSDSGRPEQFLLDARHRAEDAERRNRMVSLAWTQDASRP